MKSSALLVMGCSVSIAFIPCSRAPATPLAVANASFESPTFADGGYAFLISPAGQGSYGWTFGDAAFCYNPTALDYSGAGGNGTPTGADGAQVAGVFQSDYSIFQRLAGPDSLVGNGDDPLFQPATTYSLTVAVGQRNPVNQFGVTYGGYRLELLAGVATDAAVIASVLDVEPLTPGSLVDRTLVVNSDTVQGHYGQPLTIRLRLAAPSSTGNIDFDNVRFDAVPTPPPGDFDLDQYVDGRDFLIWQRGFGKSVGAQVADGNADGDSDVDGADLAVWRSRFGIGAVPVGTAVPELGGASLLLIAAMSTAGLRNRVGR